MFRKFKKFPIFNAIYGGHYGRLWSTLGLYRDTGDVPWVVGLSGGKDSTALTMLLER